MRAPAGSAWVRGAGHRGAPGPTAVPPEWHRVRRAGAGHGGGDGGDGRLPRTAVKAIGSAVVAVLQRTRPTAKFASEALRVSLALATLWTRPQSVEILIPQLSASSNVLETTNSRWHDAENARFVARTINNKEQACAFLELRTLPCGEDLRPLSDGSGRIRV
jgi:hypothetical protein